MKPCVICKNRGFKNQYQSNECDMFKKKPTGKDLMTCEHFKDATKNTDHSEG